MSFQQVKAGSVTPVRLRAESDECVAAAYVAENPARIAALSASAQHTFKCQNGVTST